MKSSKTSSAQAAKAAVSKFNKLAYQLAEFCDLAGIGKSLAYEEIRAGKLIARKARGRTLILHTDGENYLASLPQIEPSQDEADAGPEAA